MRISFLPLVIFFLFGCKTKQETMTTTNSVGSKTVTAKVIYEPFINKAGKVIEGVGDYFLIYDDIQWFVKFSESQIKPEQLRNLIDQNTTFELMEMEGLWDTDDPNVQSRIGKYVAILQIIP